METRPPFDILRLISGHLKPREQTRLSAVAKWAAPLELWKYSNHLVRITFYFASSLVCVVLSWGAVNRDSELPIFLLDRLEPKSTRTFYVEPTSELRILFRDSGLVRFIPYGYGGIVRKIRKASGDCDVIINMGDLGPVKIDYGHLDTDKTLERAEQSADQKEEDVSYDKVNQRKNNTTFTNRKMMFSNMEVLGAIKTFNINGNWYRRSLGKTFDIRLPDKLPEKFAIYGLYSLVIYKYSKFDRWTYRDPATGEESETTEEKIRKRYENQQIAFEWINETPGLRVEGIYRWSKTLNTNFNILGFKINTDKKILKFSDGTIINKKALETYRADGRLKGSNSIMKCLAVIAQARCPWQTICVNENLPAITAINYLGECLCYRSGKLTPRLGYDILTDEIMIFEGQNYHFRTFSGKSDLWEREYLIYEEDDENCWKISYVMHESLPFDPDRYSNAD